jgi:hypothetical protein
MSALKPKTRDNYHIATTRNPNSGGLGRAAYRRLDPFRSFQRHVLSDDSCVAQNLL